MDSATYKDPLGLKNDTRTYKRLYYSDDLGTISLYIYSNVVYYEVFEADGVSKAIFYYNGLYQSSKYQCPDNFTMIYSAELCSTTFTQELASSNSSTVKALLFASPYLKSLVETQTLDQQA